MKNKFLVLLLMVSLMPLQALASVQAYYFDNGTGEDSLRENYRDIDTFSPQVYYVDEDFDLNKLDDDGTLRFADRRRMKIVPLVFQQSFSRALISEILRDEDAQDDIIEALIDEAEDEDYAGWQFDFENMAPGDRDLFTRFVERAAEEFDDENLELSVAVVPRTSPYNPYATVQDLSAAYDYQALAQEADYLVAMAYNDPLSFGPTGSLPHQRAVLDFLLTLVPEQKLSLGVPLYCSKWRITGGYAKHGALTHTSTKEDYEEGQLLLEGYMEGLESEYYAYTVASGNLYITWCDGARGFEAKKELADDYNLRGISLWALGQEDEDMWDEF